MTPTGRTLADLVASSLFYPAFQTLESELSLVKLRSGEVLFTEGDPADSLYVVVFGRLRAVRGSGHGDQILGEIGRHESVGEMAMLTGEPRSATVYAIRNTEVVKLSRTGFERIAEQQPRVMLELARLITTRYQRVIDSPSVTQPVAFAVIPCDAGVPIAEFTAGLVRSLSPGSKILSLDPERIKREGERSPDRWSPDLENGELFSWFDAQELEHDYLVYTADSRPSAWTRLCLRQADLVLLVASAGATAQMDAGLRELLISDRETLRPRRELVLLYDSSRHAPSGTADWLSLLPVKAHHHVDPRQPRDYDRLARMLTGRAVGMVLGGGGARGLAHIGIVRALEEAGIPIDLVGGTSIGAVIGGQCASGWDSNRMLSECRRVFIEAGSLNDFTLPLMALLHGRRYDAALASLFTDRRIEDLPLTYFCVSTNLTRSQAMVHCVGPLRKWIGASMAVPGLGPPIFDGCDVLVDGGVLNNLPIDVMRGLGRGPVLASSVSGSVGPTLDREYADMPSPWRVLLSRFAGTPMRVPSIAHILMRSASLSNAMIRARGYPGSDLVFEPPIEGHKLLDWRSLDHLVEIGYQCAVPRIAAWRARTAAASAAGRPREGQANRRRDT